MLGFGLGLNKWRRVGGGYVGLLDLYPNAAAAYSLRKLRAAYSGAAVRVRRSSDHTEQDIGFDANGDLDTTALTTFVNADVNLFTSDYSSGGVAEPTRNNFTVTIDETKDGKTECLKAVWDGTSPSQLFKFNFLPIEQGVTFDISAEFYLEGFTSVRMGANGNAGDLNFTTNEWATYTQTITVNNTSDDFAVTLSGGTNGSTIWLKNLVITQTTADGLVSTWYDQSLSNDATQTTANNQPKIVSAGSLVVENGKAAIDFEHSGTRTPLNFTSPLIIGTSDFMILAIVKNKTNNANNYIDSDTNGLDLLYISNKPTIAESGVGQILQQTSTVNNTDVYLVNFLRHSGNVYSYLNGGSEVSASDSTNFSQQMGFIGDDEVVVQEVIIYPSNQSTNRTGIETNINDFYSIF